MLAKFQQFQPPFRVLSARGYTLGKFAKREEALQALNTWSQAVAVIQDDRVIARKNQPPEPARSEDTCLRIAKGGLIQPPPKKRAG